jgi:hypothetical protein
MTRHYTNRLLEMMDEGLLSAETVATMAVSFMSEDDVRQMMEANELLGYAEEDEDDDRNTNDTWYDDQFETE